MIAKPNHSKSLQVPSYHSVIQIVFITIYAHPLHNSLRENS